MPISEKVRSGPGIPTIESFASHNGTPIVIDTDTGIGYVMRGDMAIVTLDGTVVVAPPSAAYFIDSADFDGSNDYLSRASPVGAVNDPLLTLVFWIRVDVWTDGSRILQTHDEPSLINIIQLVSAGTRINYQLRDVGGSLKANISTGTLSTATWHCIMMSTDVTDTTKNRIYVGDSSSLVITGDGVGTNYDWTSAAWSWAAGPSGTNRLDGQLADIWFSPGVYIDFSVEANRRKFFSPTGKPVNLGITGNTPTGVAPLIFHHLDAGEAPANFGLNRGTGGNFTVNGTLTAGPVPPGE